MKSLHVCPGLILLQSPQESPKLISSSAAVQHVIVKGGPPSPLQTRCRFAVCGAAEDVVWAAPDPTLKNREKSQGQRIRPRGRGGATASRNRLMNMLMTTFCVLFTLSCI